LTDRQGIPEANREGGSQGPATDRFNVPVIDPTKNVLDLVTAAIGRINDLLDAGFQRQDDLRLAASDHSKQMAALRSEYEDRLAAAETARIDAIRAVDVNAVQQAATVAETRATALANQVAQSAEAMRAQVAAAAQAAATALAAALEPIQKDIQDLRKSQYELQGQRAQVVETSSHTQQRASNTGMWVGIAIAAFGLFNAFMIGVGGLALALYLNSR